MPLWNDQKSIKFDRGHSQECPSPIRTRRRGSQEGPPLIWRVALPKWPGAVPGWRPGNVKMLSILGTLFTWFWTTFKHIFKYLSVRGHACFAEQFSRCMKRPSKTTFETRERWFHQNYVGFYTKISNAIFLHWNKNNREHIPFLNNFSIDLSPEILDLQ